jgi:hypothetical protein
LRDSRRSSGFVTESSFTRAARLIDLLEEKGIVGPAKSGRSSAR